MINQSNWPRPSADEDNSSIAPGRQRPAVEEATELPQGINTEETWSVEGRVLLESVQDENLKVVLAKVVNADDMSEQELASEAEIDLECETEYITRTTARSARIAAREGAAQTRQHEFDVLFNEWRATGDPQLRERLILMNRNLVSYLARKYMDRGEMSEDVIQQGLIGLIYALDHFDPSRGVRFATFATPTILGEIRRYFRDKTWGIRVPRRLQELNQVISSKIEILSQELDRSPTYNEIARALGLQVEEIVEALEMVHAMEPLSIDEQVYSGEDDTASVVSDHLGATDPDLEGWGEYAALEAALEKLPENERRVLHMAYFQDHSQVEIARQMQVSQMYVSRLQRKALAHLRDLMNSVDI
jgi:RNA polymerase sigma-B factor